MAITVVLHRKGRFLQGTQRILEEGLEGNGGGRRMVELERREEDEAEAEAGGGGGEAISPPFSSSSVLSLQR